MGMVRVTDSSHSVCRKITWELNFHNNTPKYTVETSEVILVFILLFGNLGAVT